ncbi:MAG: hypothetical protein KGV50_02115 [Gammaproteobacteria bacterium]|nr:hypothetical protein [Gammaproteobacteria bacterium]
MKKILFTVLVASHLQAYAETLFYCSTMSGKQVLLEQKNDAVFYSYGKNLQKPEIVIEKKLHDVTYEREAYSGGGASSISIKNGKYLYNIRTGIRKICFTENCKKTHEDFGELTVYKGDKALAEINCLPKSIKLNEPTL